MVRNYRRMAMLVLLFVMILWAIAVVFVPPVAFDPYRGRRHQGAADEAVPPALGRTTIDKASEIMDPEIPSAITRETLAKIPDDQLWYVLYHYAIDRIDGDGANWNARIAALPRGLRMIYHLNTIEFEVPNGGFSQYFYNVEGKWVAEALDSLHRIGAKRRAEVLEQAISLFERKVGRRRDDPERWQGPWFDSPELDELDRQYPVVWGPAVVNSFSSEERERYEREAPEEELKGFDRYVREHPEEFLHP